MSRTRFQPIYSGTQVPLVRLLVIAIGLGGTFALNVRAGEAVDRLERAIDEYSQLDVAAQQRWLSDLFRFRSEPACRLTMKPSEIERQLVRQRVVLDRIADGRQLSTAGLHQLLTEIDVQETQAIANLERTFHRAIEETLADDPAEIERRLKLWNDILSVWKDAGRPWEEQPKLIHWLESAIAHQKAFSHGRLPAAPRSGSTLLDPIPTTTADANQPVRPLPPPVDVKELRVRIEGYNLALTDLLAKLYGQEQWRADQLETVIEAMEDLAAVRADLGLYWNVLPAAARSVLKPIEPLEPAISLAASKTAAARKQLEQPTAVRNRGDDQRLQLQRLERISRRLAELTTSKNQPEAE